MTTAKEILAATSWFSKKTFYDTLSTKLQRMVVEDGHVFFFEGQRVDSILIIEEGRLSRTKSSGSHDLESVNETLKDTNGEQKATKPLPSENIEKWSTLVDEVTGFGNVTGLLHVLNPDHGAAYATVKSCGKAIVWKIEAKDFLDVMSSNPTLAMDLLSTIAFKMRAGSRSLRAMIESAKQTRKHRDGKISHERNSRDGADTKANAVVKVLCYDSTEWVQPSFKPAIESFNEKYGSDCVSIQMDYTNDRLSEQSATHSAGYDAVCLFVNDTADANVMRMLSLFGVKLIAMRCAGFDRIDTKAAKAHGLTVVRVPAYSPHAVAEHAVSLLMAVNRKICAASTRVKMANFTLDQSLIGVDIFEKKVAVMGTGKIGQILVKILTGFGAKILCYDIFESSAVKDLGATYTTKEDIYQNADIIFLMMPLFPATKHTINMEVISKVKKGVLIINTSRGGLIDTKALIEGLRSGKIGGVGLDVFENEQEYFFQDWSARSIDDSDLTSLLGNNKVVMTAHQAFFTKEAVKKIVDTTLENIKEWKYGSVGQKHSNNCIFDKK